MNDYTLNLLIESIKRKLLGHESNAGKLIIHGFHSMDKSSEFLFI